MEVNAKDTARVFKGISDINRLNILMLLQEGELCAYQIQDRLEIGQSTLSHHMSVLCASGIVKARRKGKWTFYSIDPEGVRQAHALLEQYTGLK